MIVLLLLLLLLLMMTVAMAKQAVMSQVTRSPLRLSRSYAVPIGPGRRRRSVLGAQAGG